METAAPVAGILGLALILSVSIYVYARYRIEQEKTLQKLIERGLSGDELLRATGIAGRGTRDLRRGVLLIAVGFSWSFVTFFIGGTAWTAGIVPMAIGAAYVLFRVLNGGPR